MTVTHTPTGQDLVCLVCRTDKDIDIDHVVNRGSGGSKQRDVPENKVPLCRECHTAKTNGVLETQIREARFTNRPWALFYEWRRRNSSGPRITVPVEVSDRYHCLVLSAAAEAGTGDDSVASPIPITDSSAAAPSVGQEESDERQEVGTLAPPFMELEVAPMTAGSNLALTHEQRAAIAAGIKEMEWGRQWLAGDTAIEFIAELGESAEQYISDFGYQPEPMSNIIRVCEAIPPPFRHEGLRFSHHVVVYDLNREDMEMWLDKCAEEGWSVSEFRIKVKGERPRVKRSWSETELREKESEFAMLGWEIPDGSEIRMFLDWLVRLGDQA